MSLDYASGGSGKGLLEPRKNLARRLGWDWSSIFAALPAVEVIFICCVMPLCWMAWVVITNPSVRSEFALSSFRMHLLGRTVFYNALVAIFATAMGLPAAFVLGRGRGLIARMLWVILPAALLMPSLSYAYGWSQFVRLIRPYVEPRDLFMFGHKIMTIGTTFPANGPADIFRCIWSLSTWLWAVPAALVGISLRRMDTNVQQQAQLDGALRRITFRQLLGPILASMAIVTVLATQEFSVYEPTGISVVATEVRMIFDTGSVSSSTNSITKTIFDSGKKSPDQAARAAAAVATATPLLIVTVLLCVAAAWGAKTSGASETLSVGDWPPALDATRSTVLLTVSLLLINIGVPVACLIGSLHNGHNASWMWREFAPQVEGSMIVAAEATALALIAAMFCAAKWTPGILVIAVASFLIGGQLLAIALIRIFNRPGLFWMYDTSVVPMIAYVGRFGWLAVAAGRGTWSRPWRELREMASVDGASALSAARGVVWPLAWPTLLAGGLLVGALSLTEVPATVLIMPLNPQVLTPTLMTWLHMVRYDPMIEASLVMMGTVLVPALAAVLLASLGMTTLRKDRRRI